jgi:hypothetical protein
VHLLFLQEIKFDKPKTRKPKRVISVHYSGGSPIERWLDKRVFSSTVWQPPTLCPRCALFIDRSADRFLEKRNLA